MRTLVRLLLLMAWVPACGEADTVNTARAGYVALGPDEAWRELRRAVPAATAHVLCEGVGEPCAERSAYLRDRTTTYWFVLHEVASDCVAAPCPPDRFHYLEIDALGRLFDHGDAAVRYDAAGSAELVAGTVQWGVPDLTLPRPRGGAAPRDPTP